MQRRIKKRKRRKGKASRVSDKRNREQQERERAKKLVKEVAAQAIEAYRSSSAQASFTWKTCLRYFLWLPFLIFGFLFPYAEAYSVFYPRLSVEQGEAFDEMNALSFPLKITNENFFGLHDVEYECVLMKASAAHGLAFFGNKFLPGDRFIGNLSSGDPFTISCEFIEWTLQLPLNTMEFRVTVSFRPAFIPINADWARFSREFRFLVTRHKDGRVRLDPQPSILPHP